MPELRCTILGCGSSGGVPRLGGHWGDCDPENPKNSRRRCSILVQQDGPEGTTTVLIDTSPDMRSQLLDAGIGRLDAVVYTHAHADHVHGLDDLRMVVFNMRERIPVYADTPTKYGATWGWNLGPTGRLEKNRWYSIEQYVKMNDPGRANGLLRAWIDGILVFERSDIRFRSTSDLKIEALWMNVYHGGTMSAPQDLSLFIDNVVVATQYIGTAGK